MKLIPRFSRRRFNDTTSEIPTSEPLDDQSSVTGTFEEDARSLFATNIPLVNSSNGDSLTMQTVMGERLLRYILRRAASGVKLAGKEPISSAQKLAEKYANNTRYATVDEKVKAMIQHETAKGFACGFGTSVGGVWTTLTVGAPMGMILSFVIQARLASAIAILYGQNIVSQPVEVLVLLSVIGSMSLISRFLREAAEVTVTKMTTRAVSKVVATSSARTLMAIKRKIGVHILARVLPKSSAKTVMTSTSSVVAPLVGNLAGGLLGGVLDAVSIRTSAKLACKVFRDGYPISQNLAVSLPHPSIPLAALEDNANQHQLVLEEIAESTS